MATTVSRQYRRPPTLLGGSMVDAPLCLHVVRELEWAINNAKMYACAHKARSILCYPKWESPSSTTNERVIHVLAPFRLAEGYNALRWHVGHERSEGTGSDQVTWRLYNAGQLYTGPDIVDLNYMASGPTSTSWISTSDTHAIATGGLATPTHGNRYSDDLVWLVLTSQANTVNARARLTTIDLTPRLYV